jgi:hypothetical protein
MLVAALSYSSLVDVIVAVFLGAAAVSIGNALTFEALVLCTLLLGFSIAIAATALFRVGPIAHMCLFLERYIGRGALFILCVSTSVRV